MRGGAERVGILTTRAGDWGHIARQKLIRHAHDLVRKAIQRGDLIRPHRCDKCNTETFTLGHHHDYDQPLAVIWLCPYCHKHIFERSIPVIDPSEFHTPEVI